MALINNAGGSLTSAILLTVLAWGVRWLRAEVKRKRRDEESGRAASRQSLGRFSGRLSPVALRMLVRLLLCGEVAACMAAQVDCHPCLPARPHPPTRSTWLQVETGPYPHHVIILRPSGPHDALPAELRGALRLPGGLAVAQPQ